MKKPSDRLPARIDKDGVLFRSEDWGGMSVTRVSLPKGADASPLLKGMPGDMCQVPHWGVVQKGSIHVRYSDGREETVAAGEIYHWPAGHTVWVDEDYEAVEFSPAGEMNEVLAHLANMMGA